MLALPAPGPAGAAPAGTATARISLHRVIGHSVRGRAINAYYRGTRDATHVLVLLGQMHGDEHAGPRTAAWVRRRITPKAGTGIWIVPSMNPDGNARNTRKNARGVDLNRNWPTSGWRHSAPGSRYYGGRRPASEPETRAMMRFISQIRPDYIASIHQPLDGIGRGGGRPRWLRAGRERTNRDWRGSRATTGGPRATQTPIGPFPAHRLALGP